MRHFLLLISLVAAATSHAEETTEQSSAVAIPLSEVIGLGQRGLRVLEPDLLVYRDTPEKIEKYSTPEGMEEARKLAAKSLVVPIERAMDKRQADSAGSAGQGFAVAGRGRDALPGIYDVLVKGKKAASSFNTETEISVVFFSLKWGGSIRINSVERTGGLVTIHYMMLPHGLRVQNWRLALIPLGKLPPGKYRVQTVRAESEEETNITSGAPPIREGAEKGVVCESFDFEVRSNK